MKGANSSAVSVKIIWRRIAIALLGLIATAMDPVSPLCADMPTSPGVEAVIPLDMGAEAQPTTATPPPRFDVWAWQSKLKRSLPAIGSWKVLRHVHADTRVPPDAPAGVGPPQVIFSQRPYENIGLSKYSVIYQASERDLADRKVWLEVAAAFSLAFPKSLSQSNLFKTIQVSSPTVSTLAEMRRLYLDYQVEKKSGGWVGGAVLCIPAYKGVLFFTVSLEGQGREVVEAVMRELRHAINVGLTKRPGSARPYIIAALVAFPFMVLVVAVVRKRLAK